MGKKKALSRAYAQRKEAMLTCFAKEDRAIRDELARDLPAYNELLNMNACSFQEFALRRIAREKGLDVRAPGFSYDAVVPDCPHCGAHEVRKGTNPEKYSCRKCGKTFSANYKSISYGSKCSALIWLKVLHCLLEHYSIDRTVQYCGISRDTYYLIRNKLFYAMRLLMERVRLYGIVQCDNTFLPVSYRGSSLDLSDVPDGSPFPDPQYVPRSARQRGGRYGIDQRNENSVCIFCAVDDSGHVMAKMVGLGMANATLLHRAIGSQQLLAEAPQEKTDASARQTVLVTDGEKALKKYAEAHGFLCESHVYRRNGKQVRIASQAHHIQNVNALHSRLKAFWRNCGYVSTKYLPGFLTLFEFIENTGASADAITELFELLAEPQLGRPPSFYEGLFTMPTILRQTAPDGMTLPKVDPAKIEAAYLYECHIVNRKSGCRETTVEEIGRQFGHTAAWVRNQHRGFRESGHLPAIMKYFDGAPRQRARHIEIPPDILFLHDEIGRERTLHREQRRSQKEIYNQLAQASGISCTYGTYRVYWRPLITKNGIRPPWPRLGDAGKGALHKLTDTQKQYVEVYFLYQKKKLELLQVGQYQAGQPLGIILAQLELPFEADAKRRRYLYLQGQKWRTLYPRECEAYCRELERRDGCPPARKEKIL